MKEDANENILVKFRNLSFWIQLPLILSYIIGGIYLLFFLIGFIQGIWEL